MRYAFQVAGLHFSLAMEARTITSRTLWTAITRAIRRRERRPPTGVKRVPNPAGDQAPPVKWDESWNSDTARLAYEHARDVYRIVDAATDVLDRKVVAVFTVASAVAAVAPVIGKIGRAHV